MNKILLVDDEPDIIELLQYNLEQHGYVVETALDGLQALEKAKVFKPELVILDVMMPKLNGIETSKQLRQMPEFKNTFILFLTARSEELTEISAFDAGADDFLSKPIKPMSLMSRINALFRREASKTQPDGLLEIKGLKIDKKTYSVSLPTGKQVIMPRKEFDLLYFLAQKPNKVFNREELLEKIWGADIYVVERTVDVHIRKIREKIGDSYIKTLKGVGYLFESV
jgi:two-component system, OmpR family, alkaline phosphatase synthesis response regulator PhoP